MRKHMPVKLAKNPIMVYVDAADAGIAARENLRYFCEIQIPKAYLSGEFLVLETLSGFEPPPQTDGFATIYKGWSADIAPYLGAVLEPQVVPSTVKDWWIDPEVITPFRTRTWIEDGGVLVPGSEILSPVLYALLAGLNEEDFPAWKEQVFTGYMDERRQFLTWQPQDLKFDSHAPVLLSFLTNYNTMPGELKLVCEFDFTDASSVRQTVCTIASPLNYVVYTFNGQLDRMIQFLPAGEAVKKVRNWELWVEDPDGLRLSEKRRFFLETRFEPYARYFVFMNGLGGWDCLRTTGVGTEKTSIGASMAERALGGNYSNADEEVFTTDKSGSRALRLSTGPAPTAAWAEYLQDLLWSHRVFLYSEKRGFIAVQLSGETDKLDGEWLPERELEFRKSKAAKGYSALHPDALPTQRKAVWVPQQEYCLVDRNGMRTGKSGYATLRLVYEDNGEYVPGVGLKTNAPGTEGYVEAVDDINCAAGTTPYANMEINRRGSYYKSDCPAGKAGDRPDIIIAAGTYGSDVGQADADAKALAAWNVLNTQEYADANGACVIPVSNGLRAAFWNYGAGVHGPGPVFNFESLPKFAGTRANLTLTGAGNAQISEQWPAVDAAGVGNDRWVAEWNGYIKAGTTTGGLQISVPCSDGCRVWINDVLVLDSWHYGSGISTLRQSGPLDIEAGNLYKVRIRFFHLIGFTAQYLKWRWPGQAEVDIPDTALFYV